jgi:hypothetical protein
MHCAFLSGFHSPARIYIPANAVHYGRVTSKEDCVFFSQGRKPIFTASGKIERPFGEKALGL